MPEPESAAASRREVVAEKADRKGKDKERGKSKARRRERPEMQMRKAMMAQQQMQMAMMGMGGMGGMGHPAMQMAMMQQMNPQYLQAMQQQQMMQAMQKSKRRNGGGSSSSSSGSSSDSDSSASGPPPGVLPPNAAMAAMAAMWPTPGAGMGGFPHPPGTAPPPPAPPAPPGAEESVEAFLARNPVDPEAADRLRALPPTQRQEVMRRGPVSDTRSPSAVLVARVRDAELGRSGVASEAGIAASPQALALANTRMAITNIDDERGRPARRSAKVTIEAMVRDYRLSPGCAWMLRALPPDKQKLAARIDPAGQADPSGYVAEQLKHIV